jgi:hypothetical protein
VNLGESVRRLSFMGRTAVRCTLAVRMWARSGPEVGLGAITTPSGAFQPEFVVHCLAESLLADEITFSRLNRCKRPE